MSKPLTKKDLNWGAGKGDAERPVDRKRFATNFDEIRWSGQVSGVPVSKKGAKKTYRY